MIIDKKITYIPYTLRLVYTYFVYNFIFEVKK